MSATKSGMKTAILTKIWFPKEKETLILNNFQQNLMAIRNIILRDLSERKPCTINTFK